MNAQSPLRILHAGPFHLRSYGYIRSNHSIKLPNGFFRNGHYAQANYSSELITKYITERSTPSTSNTNYL